MRQENLPKRTDRITKKGRLGRGSGSRGGHTVGRGHKGQLSRSGHKSMAMFEGGNLPFFKRVPKLKGFKRNHKIVAAAVNLSTINEFYKDGESVTPETLKEKGVIRKNARRVKILGNGELAVKAIFDGVEFSDTARGKITKAKGVIK